MIEARFVIVGAGFAGAATAYHLARRGRGPVVILERENAPGLHSSGRNAAMVRQLVPDPLIMGLALEGARAILSFSESGSVEYEKNGSLLLASGERVMTLAREASIARGSGLETQEWSREAAIDRIPVLEGADFEKGCFCPTDGVVDIAGLLECYLRGAREAGAQVLLKSEAIRVLEEGGRVAGVQVGDRVVRAPTVINAAGAWAGPFAAGAGAAPIPITVLRRHLIFTGPLERSSRSWPFVWDVSHEVYFRPESSGLLLSPCDEKEVPPGIPGEDPGAVELLAEKLHRHLPGLGDIPVARTWAGLRVFSQDGRFVIGPDPLLPGFHWVAALGGHGVTTSYAVGALAADLVENPEKDLENPFSPKRFLGSSPDNIKTDLIPPPRK